MMLTLQDAVKVLRGWQGKHTTGALIVPETGARCAMGVLGGEAFGFTPEEDARYTYVFMGEQLCLPEYAIGKCYGIGRGLVGEIIEWNDRDELSLDAIADKLEEYDRMQHDGT